MGSAWRIRHRILSNCSKIEEKKLYNKLSKRHVIWIRVSLRHQSLLFSSMTSCKCHKIWRFDCPLLFPHLNVEVPESNFTMIALTRENNSPELRKRKTEITNVQQVECDIFSPRKNFGSSGAAFVRNPSFVVNAQFTSRETKCRFVSFYYIKARRCSQDFIISVSAGEVNALLSFLLFLKFSNKVESVCVRFL